MNRQLYIETQKQSYLLKRSRCKDDVFDVYDEKVTKLFWTQSNAFNYSLPTDMFFRLGQSCWCTLPMSKDYVLYDFFRRLMTLECDNLFSLSYIPCEILFDSKYIVNKYGHGQAQSNYKLEKFSINGYVNVSPSRIPAIMKNVNTFCQRLKTCKNDIINTSEQNIRMIETLSLNIRANEWDEEKKAHQKNVIMQLLLACAGITESICLTCGILEIKSMEQLQTIFNNRLKKIRLTSRAGISYDINVINSKQFDSKDQCDKYDNQNEDSTDYDKVSIGNLEQIGFEVGCNDRTVSSIHFLNTFGMRKNLKNCKIYWSPRSDNFVHSRSYLPDKNLKVFDKIFFQDYDEHPLLETITIKFSDKYDLCYFARLLIYFNDNHQQLFVERKLYLPHFKQIEIEFEQILISSMRDGTNGSKLQPHKIKLCPNESYDAPEIFFHQDANEDYSTKEKMIVIENIKPGIENYGIIYQNMFKWLLSIQEQSSGDVGKAVSGCKVVLTCS